MLSRAKDHYFASIFAVQIAGGGKKKKIKQKEDTNHKHKIYKYRAACHLLLMFIYFFQA